MLAMSAKRARCGDVAGGSRRAGVPPPPARPVQRSLGQSLLSSSRGLSSDDARKVLCAAAAVCQSEARADQHMFASKAVVPASALEAASWAGRHTADERIFERELQIRSIEARGRVLGECGATADWLGNCSRGAQRVCATVNGPLLCELAAKIEHGDRDIGSLLQQGARLLGDLPRSGNGRAAEFAAPASARDLWWNAAARNKELLATLREDRVHSEEIWRQTMAEVDAGRMTVPRPVEEFDLSSILLSPRFVVEQLKEDGSVKLRMIDDFSRSGCNDAVRPCERLAYDGVDVLFALSQHLMSLQSAVLAPWKADIDSAYRRIPVHEEDLWAAHVVFVCRGRAYVSRHNAVPFGATGSVHGWDRLGALLAAIARSELHLAALRWVDDYHGAEPECTVAHAKLCFARLVRALLGPSAVADRKLQHGNGIVVLGLEVHMDALVFRCWPDKAKVDKWLRRIEGALKTNKLQPGHASKLSGGLSWTVSNMYRRVGRGLLPPLYAQSRGRSSRMSKQLAICLRWWAEVLPRRALQSRPWAGSDGPTINLFCDARGAPAHIAAVLFIGDRVLYTDMAVPRYALGRLYQRKDQQIMASEMLSIGLGLATFAHAISGRRGACSRASRISPRAVGVPRRRNLRVWSDNTGAESAVRRAAATEVDHGCIAHIIWTLAFELRCGLWVDRVSSADNPADPPSRESYELMDILGAHWIRPIWDARFDDPTSWLAVRASRVKGCQARGRAPRFNGAANCAACACRLPPNAIMSQRVWCMPRKSACLMGLTIVSAGSAREAASGAAMRAGFPARVACPGAWCGSRAPISEDAGEMSFLSELAGLCPSAPRAALAWAVDFFSDNGFLSAAELAGADLEDLEGWSVTAAVNVDTVLNVLKAANARKDDGAALQCRRGVPRESARAPVPARAGAVRPAQPGEARARPPRSRSPPGQEYHAPPASDLPGELVDGALARFGASRAGVSAGPRAAISDLQAVLGSESERQEWIDSAWNAAVLGNNLHTRASIKAGLRCWFAFSVAVLHVRADRALPPSVRGLVSWSLVFKCAGTFANYVSHVKIGCLLAGVPIDVFEHPVVKRARAAVASRGLHASRPRHFVRHALLERLVRLASAAAAAEQWRYLWIVAYAFLLRVPSEAIPLRAGDPGVPAAWQAGLFVHGEEMRLRLRTRKNRRQGSLLSRRCWCADSSATCPVHALGPWLARHRRGEPLFPLVSSASALCELRRALRILGVPDAAQYCTHDFRRGHAEAPARPALR